MGSCNHKSTRRRNFQVYLPSLWLVLFFLNPIEATDIDNDYDETQARPRYKRVMITILGYIAITASFVICNCLRKLRQRNDDEAAEQDNEHSMTMATRKLDIRVIESFPVIIFPPSDAKFRCTECHICLEELEQGETIVVLPACGHGYHKECVLRWMTTRDSRCPDCRHDYWLV